MPLRSFDANRARRSTALTRLMTNTFTRIPFVRLGRSDRSILESAAGGPVSKRTGLANQP